MWQGDAAAANLQRDSPSLNVQENKVPVSKEDKRVLKRHSRAATASHQSPGRGQKSPPHPTGGLSSAWSQVSQMQISP